MGPPLTEIQETQAKAGAWHFPSDFVRNAIAIRNYMPRENNLRFIYRETVHSK